MKLSRLKAYLFRKAKPKCAMPYKGDRPDKGDKHAKP